MGNLFVISSPSGGGKGTILKQIMKMDDKISLSISATTRAPREGEEHGVHYYFITREEFIDKIENNLLLEYAEYAGNYYGTPLDFIDAKLSEDKDVILEIELKGALIVKELRPKATLIFIAPPSFEELERRLINRDTEDLETIKKRMEIAKVEIASQHEFHHIVVNDEVLRASEEILSIIKKGRE